MAISMNELAELAASFRRIAEDAERDARSAGIDRVTQTNLIDAAAKCHWLAGEASTLCRKLGPVPATCERCSEKCLRSAEESLAFEATGRGQSTVSPDFGDLRVG